MWIFCKINIYPDEMAGWHHWLDGCESEWTPGVGDGQGGLACCNSWGRKESDTTERLIWSDLSSHCKLFVNNARFFENIQCFLVLLRKDLFGVPCITSQLQTLSSVRFVLYLVADKSYAKSNPSITSDDVFCF